MSYLGTTKIGKMFLGTTEISKAYLGNTLVFQSGDSPSPTNTVSYIRYTDSSQAYIDTGITADNTTKIIVWARNFVPLPESNPTLFGCGDGTNYFRVYLAQTSGTGRIGLRYGSASVKYIDDAIQYLGHYNKYEFGPDGFLVNDVLLDSVGVQTFSINNTIHLMGSNESGTHSYPRGIYDISACKIYKNGVLVRDLVATDTPSVGMYDLVSGTLFTNAGLGTLTYGTFEKDAYTPLEYIECTESQYFDTGIKGGYAVPWIFTFTPTGTTARFDYPLGASTGTSNRCEIGVGNTTYINARLYFNYQGTSNTIIQTNINNHITNKKIYYTKINNKASAYSNNTQIGSTATGDSGDTFETDYNLYIGARNNEGTVAAPTNSKIYFAGFGSLGNFMPAEVEGVAGMYDTINDQFYSSISETEFIAGPELQSRTQHFQYKRIAIIGDSISTYDQTGYKYDSYRMYYPKGDVDSVEDTWWKRLIDSENGTLDVNLAYSGSFSSNYNPDYPTFYDRTSLIDQADVIIVAIGTNDSSNSVSLGDFDYTSEMGDYDMSKFRDSYIKGIRSLMSQYPNAEIVCAIFSMGNDYRNSIKTIAEHYELTVVDCGNDYKKYTTVHPDEYGMIEIYRNFLFV